MRYHYPQKQIINSGRAHESRVQGPALPRQGNQIISKGEIYLSTMKLNILLYMLKEKKKSFSHVSFLFLIKERERSFRVFLENGDSKDLNLRIKHQQWAVSTSYFLLVIAYETLIKPQPGSHREIL